MSCTRTMDKQTLKAALHNAAITARTVPPQRASGCGRAYVVLTGVARKGKGAKANLQMWDDAAKASGLMFLKEAYGVSGCCLYIGYDNADGRALARANSIAESLVAAGIGAYMDAVQD
jgi:hypothetical protein